MNMGNIKVVIAEDDKQIAEIQKRFLMRISGFELVGIAHDLDVAKELVEVFKPDLLLLDVQFPSGTGLDLLTELRSNKNSIDVILITASKEVDTFKQAMMGGVVDYILKPIVFERLNETLTSYQKKVVKLNAIESIEQLDVDNLLSRNAASVKVSAAPERLPKGIDSLTLKKIKEIFKTHSATFTAEELGGFIGASRTTARRYAEYLVLKNEIQVEANYGTVGRPERKYTAIKIDVQT